MSAYSEHTFSFPKLNNENYKEWKYSIDLYLISQDLQNYTSDKIIDEEKSPSKTPDAEKEKLKEGKALAVICLSIREDLKSIVYEAHTPSEAWKLLKTVFEPVSRARVARLRRNFMNTRYTPDEPMSSYLNRITLAAKELEQAGKKVEDDEVAFQILENLPDSYESLVAQLYRLTDAEFTVKGIRSHLLAEYDRQRNRSLQISDNLPASQALVSTEDSRPKEYFNRDEGRRCYRCGLKGHLIKNCRVKPKSKKRYHQSSKGRQAHFAAAMMSEHTSLEFVLDSAATDHFSNNKKVFQNFRSFKTKAAIACGSTDILGIGDIQLVFNTELSDVREANDHFVRMRSGAFCRWPRPQAVCVKDLYPEKEFLPRCTLLHRCTETAGCCEEEGYQCGPKAMQEVVLHFYVLGGDHMSSDVEKLFFVNHTECECKPKPSPKPTTASSTTNAPTSPVPSYYYPQRDQQNPKCRSCPAPFCVREHEDGRCSCDCFDRHKPCIRIKRGREPLADIERRCVLSGQCNIPDCEYGSYDPEKARCPKRPDHLGPREGEYVKRPLPNHKNPNHRWLYFERD